MMWLLIMADPGHPMAEEDIPKAESLREASQVEADQRLVASVELLKPPPAIDLSWLQQDVASTPNWCSSIRLSPELVNSADELPEAVDDLVNCVAGGERRWTNQSKCDS
jgi:hypothetical protein